MKALTELIEQELGKLCDACPHIKQHRGARDTVDGSGVGPPLEPDYWTCPAGEPYLCVGDPGCPYKDYVDRVWAKAEELREIMEEV